MRIPVVVQVGISLLMTVSSALAQPAPLYGVDEHEVFRIDAATGATNTIGTLGRGLRRMTDIAVAPDGTIYALTIDSLLQFDPAAATTFEVGALNVPGNANALAADRSGRLFGATEDGTFFEVDPSTGQGRVIGSFGSTLTSEGDLAFAPDGSLYATTATNELLRIDPSTGAATVVGDTKSKQLDGLAFDADGRLYASSVGASLLIIDTSSAKAVDAGTFSNLRHMTGLAIVPLIHLRASTEGLTVRLAWDAMAASVSYVLEAGSSPGLSDLYSADIGNVTTLTASAPAGTYFLRLRPRTPAGVGAASNEVQILLGSPSCVSPPVPTGFLASVRRNQLTLQWDATPGGASYHLEAGTASGLANVYSGNVGSDTMQQFDIAGIPPMLYYLRLRAVAACGIPSAAVEIVLDRR